MGNFIARANQGGVQLCADAAQNPLQVRAIRRRPIFDFRQCRSAALRESRCNQTLGQPFNGVEGVGVAGEGG